MKEDKDEKKENEDFSTIFKNFAANTTAHGFSQIFLSANPAIKLLWISAIIGCNVMICYQIKPLIVEYMNKPTKTQIILSEEQSQVFPVVTVCNVNILLSSHFEKFMGKHGINGRYELLMKLKTGIKNASNLIQPLLRKRRFVYNLFKKITEAPENTTKTPGKMTKAPGKTSKTSGKTSKTSGKTSKTSGKTAKPASYSLWSYLNYLRSAKTTDDKTTHDKTKQNKTKTFLKQTDDHNEFTTREKDVVNYWKKWDLLQTLGNFTHEYGEDIFWYGHQFDDLIVECKWKDFYNCHDPKWWRRTWHWRYGNCYSFNSGLNESLKLQSVTGTGPYNGLSLTLSLQQNEYMDDFITDSAGVVLYVGDQGAPIDPHLSGHRFAPNFEHFVSITKKQVIRADPFRNESCIAHTTVSRGQRSFSEPYTTKYTLNACKEICEASVQIKRCGCTSFWLPSLDSNMTCDDQDLECTDEIHKDFIDGILPCLKGCRLPCNEVKYVLEMSMANYPTWKTKIQNESHDNLEYSTDEHMKMRISFKTLETEVISNVEYYFIEKLLGDIGGQLGLWTGISALTMVELMLFFGQNILFFFNIFGAMAVQKNKNIDNQVEMNDSK